MMYEWAPAVGSRVVDTRSDLKGEQGVVVKCVQLGHFADPYWRAVVRWDRRGVEYEIPTIRLDPAEQGRRDD